MPCRIFAGLTLLVTMPSPHAPRAQVVEVPVIERGAVSGAPQRIDIFYDVNPDCSESGLPAVHVAQPPAHGRIVTVVSLGNTEFPPGTQQYACNLRKLPVLLLVYLSEPGFQGSDTLGVSVIYPSGARRVLRFVLTVESAVPTGGSARPGNWVHV